MVYFLIVFWYFLFYHSCHLCSFDWIIIVYSLLDLIDFSILLIILSRFLKWTLTDTMDTLCLILAAHTGHVMKFLVWDRFVTLVPSIQFLISLLFWEICFNIFFLADIIVGAWSNWESKKAGIVSWYCCWKGAKGD